jgi:hypothetical protein
MAQLEPGAGSEPGDKVGLAVSPTGSPLFDADRACEA